jgi:endopolyphosphatase
MSDLFLDFFHRLYEPQTALDLDCRHLWGDAGKWGTRLYCDAPTRLIDYSFEFLRQLVQANPPDFVIWTGDNARHDSDPLIKRTKEEVLGLNWRVAQYVSDVFGPSPSASANIPVIPSIGNNDVSPHNFLAAGPNDGTFIIVLEFIIFHVHTGSVVSFCDPPSH